MNQAVSSSAPVQHSCLFHALAMEVVANLGQCMLRAKSSERSHEVAYRLRRMPKVDTLPLIPTAESSSIVVVRRGDR